MALQTLSDATPTEAIHWPDVLQRAAGAAWQQAVEIDDCSRQNSAYRLTPHLYEKTAHRVRGVPFLLSFIPRPMWLRVRLECRGRRTKWVLRLFS